MAVRSDIGKNWNELEYTSRDVRELTEQLVRLDSEVNRRAYARMKFIYADSLDVVDPDFDFATDRNAHGRVVHADDEYPHEFLRRAPYDGILAPRGIVGGKYSDAQRMRFRRDGARAFLDIAKISFREASYLVIVRFNTACSISRHGRGYGRLLRGWGFNMDVGRPPDF